jgi:GNAT superfamily N-acetyltransferase
MWGSDMALNSSYFEWKHNQNPYVEEPIFFLALYEGRVVGVRGMCGSRWDFGQPGKIYNCLADVDSVVSPDHRRQGLLTRMSMAALEELKTSTYEYVITLSANRYSSAANIKMGWRNVGYFGSAQQYAGGSLAKGGTSARVRGKGSKIPLIPTAYRRMRKFLKRKSPQAREKLPPFHELDERYARREVHIKRNISLDKHPRPKMMAEFINRIDTNGRIRHVRDEEFFKWRFQNPRSSFRFIFWEESQLSGYLILHAQAYKPGVITIVDWEAENEKIRTEILKTAIEMGKFKILSLWSGSLSADTRKILSDFDFDFVEPSGDPDQDADLSHILLKPTRQEKLHDGWAIGDSDLLELANWDLRAIYSDSY